MTPSTSLRGGVARGGGGAPPTLPPGGGPAGRAAWALPTPPAAAARLRGPAAPAARLAALQRPGRAWRRAGRLAATLAPSFLEPDPLDPDEYREPAAGAGEPEASGAAGAAAGGDAASYAAGPSGRGEGPHLNPAAAAEAASTLLAEAAGQASRTVRGAAAARPAALRSCGFPPLFPTSAAHPLPSCIPVP